MRRVYRIRTQDDRRRRRHLRVRKKIRGTAARPRLVVFRSSKHIYAQLVDDDQGTALLGGSDRSAGIAVEVGENGGGATATGGKVARGLALGKLIAAKAKERGITQVVFDRGGYRYHGRVKAVADGARQGGLEL